MPGARRCSPRSSARRTRRSSLRKVAEWLVGRLQAWVPLASWTVLEDDLMGPPRALAGGPLEGDALTIVASVASRAIRLGEELVTSNLQDHLVSAPPVAALGAAAGRPWRGHRRRRRAGRGAGRDAARLRRRHAPCPGAAARSGRGGARQRPPHGAGRGAVRHRRPDPALQCPVPEAGADARIEAIGPIRPAAVADLPRPGRLQGRQRSPRPPARQPHAGGVCRYPSRVCPRNRRPRPIRR